MLRLAPWRQTILAPRQQRRLLCSPPKHQNLSLVGAVTAADAAADSSRRRILRGVGAAAVGYFLYDAAITAYARIMLGAAATEQLFMQGLDGEVQLELCLTAFSSQAELRGKLTPVTRKAPAGTYANHKDFSLISYPPKEGRTSSGLSHDFLKMPMDGIQRHIQGKNAREPPPPPVAATRPVSVFAPVHLSALFLGQKETRLFCRKTKYKTEYPSALPAFG